MQNVARIPTFVLRVVKAGAFDKMIDSCGDSRELNTVERFRT